MIRDSGDLSRRSWLYLLVTVAALTSGCASTVTAIDDSEAGDAVQSAQNTLAMGDEAARQGDFERALVYYLRSVELDASIDTWLRVGAASTRLGQTARALHAYMQVIELDPTRADAQEEAGLELLSLGQDMAAAEHLARAVELEPLRWRSHNALGILADRKGDHAAAIAHYEVALDNNARSPMLINNIGYSRYLSGDLEQAARDFYAVTEIDPDYAPAWSNLALVYADRGWYADAVSALSRVAGKAEAYNDIGYIALQRGDLAESEMLLNEAVRTSPTYYATAHKNLETLRAKRGSQ